MRDRFNARKGLTLEIISGAVMVLVEKSACAPHPTE